MTFCVGLFLLGALPANALVFNMAPLEFSNRAACADLSTKPARSVFLQIDAFNAGKAGYAQGLIDQRADRSVNPGASAQGAVKDFRLWTTYLVTQIADALLKGKLPLLPPDSAHPQSFKATVDRCALRSEMLSCQLMNDYLSELWARSKMADPHWEDLGFQKSDFFPADLRQNAAIGCHIIRKFSALHSPLKSQEVQDGMIANVAMDTFNPEKHLDSCFAAAEGADPRFTTVQIDIARLTNDEDWDQWGFSFWHSLKLFLSWAWRYAPEYRSEFGRFEQLFTSIAFEDSVMMIPNGCRSIELPRCDSTGLASDTMRAARLLGMTHPAIGEVPVRPIDSLFAGKGAPVNDDAMGLFKEGDASAWARDFKTRLSGIRYEMLKRLNSGISKLQVITSLLDAKDLSKDILAILDDPQFDKIETYLACMEYTLAKNDLYNDIDREIQTLTQNQELKSVLLTESAHDLGKYIAYYKTLTNTMGLFCKAIEQKGRLTVSMPNLYFSLNEWAYDILRPNERDKYQPQCAITPDSPPCPQNGDKRYLVARPKQNASMAGEFAICKTSLECARLVLDSLVSVISVRRYAHAFLPLEDTVASPDILNNFAAPTACKLYDPWRKQREAWKLFVADLGSAVLLGATCGAFKFQVLEFPQDRVVSYKEILEQNQSYYEPRMKTEPMKYLAGFDYAFLPALSCGVAVSNYLIPGNPYYLPGYYSDFRVRTCFGNSDTQYTVDRYAQLDPTIAQGVAEKDSSTVHACFSCGIQLSAIYKNSCTQPVLGQAVATAIGVFQGVMRLISNLSDPDNIVRSETLNVDQISQSFNELKTMTPSCHNDLKKGVTCH